VSVLHARHSVPHRVAMSALVLMSLALTAAIVWLLVRAFSQPQPSPFPLEPPVPVQRP
jgi:hypothetical protein